MKGLFIILHESFLQFDQHRAAVFQLSVVSKIIAYFVDGVTEKYSITHDISIVTNFTRHLPLHFDILLIALNIP